MTRHYFSSLAGQRAPRASRSTRSQSEPGRAVGVVSSYLNSDENDEPLESPAIAALAGIKRCRPIWPNSPAQRHDRQAIFHQGATTRCCPKAQPSEAESDGSSSSSESEIDSDYDTDFEGSESDQLEDLLEPTSADDLAMRQELLGLAHEQARKWTESVRYRSWPDDQPPRKRGRTSRRQEKAEFPGDKNDHITQKAVLSSPPTKYFHLACPFYASNPEKHQQCLLQHDLQSINDVIRHLGQHHIKSPYCPMCYQLFDTVAGRDRHILKRTCDMRDEGLLDGINGYQWSRLSRRTKRPLSEAAHCKRICTIVFPDSKSPLSLILDNGHGLAVSKIRDFWGVCGRGLVSSFLVSRGLKNDDRAQFSMGRATLNGLLDKMIEENQSPVELTEKMHLEIRLKDLVD